VALTARTGTLNSVVPKDAELIGLEVNVLNAMLPGIYPNKSKVGVRVVGFGNTTTTAFQVFPDKPGTNSGRFQNILAVDPATLTRDGTVFGIGPQQAKIGLNLQGSQFSDSAILLSSKNSITFRETGKADARIYRDNIQDGHLVLQAGPSGLRITNSADKRNLIYIHADGTVDGDSVVWRRYRLWIAAYGCVLGVLLLAIISLFAEVHRLRRIVHLSAE